MLGTFENPDRYLKEPEKAVDVLMLSLDADRYLEKCLDSVYREIPVKRIIVCDGGSKDRTVELFNSYPRVEFHVRPDIRTTGKGYEFLFQQIESPWFALIDTDVELVPGWYDEMCSYQDQYDFYECKRIMAYSFYREIAASTDMTARSLSGCQMGRKEAFAQYHCDDDYIWRTADLFANQQVVKAGYKYGKVATTHHLHHTGEGERYVSDSEKKGTGFIFKEPEQIFKSDHAWGEMMLKHARAVVKYLDPDFLNYKRLAVWLRLLDRKYIEETNPKWLPYRGGFWKIYYKEIKFSFEFTFKYFLSFPLKLTRALKERQMKDPVRRTQLALKQKK